MDEKYWDEIRSEFPVTGNICYFNSAGMSPIPNKVLNTITESYLRVNRYGDMYFGDDLMQNERLKQKLAQMINTIPSNICFAQNTSMAMSLVAAAIKKTLPFDFNIVSLEDEFPSTNIPFEFQGIPIKYVKPVEGVYSLQSILDTVDEKTMAVAVSYVQYSTGFRLDIEKLGKALVEMDLLFIVNATQAFPIFPVNVEAAHIDVLTVSFHKWGLSGVNGSLFFTSEGFRRMYPNTMAGWLSVHPPKDDFIPTQKHEAYEQFESAAQYTFGTMNFHALGGLETALDFMKEVGYDNIQKRIAEVSSYLVDELKELDVNVISPRNGEQWSGIILIDLHCKHNAEAVEYLRKHKIVVALRAGKIRVSVNFFNNFQEADHLVSTLGLFCEMYM